MNKRYGFPEKWQQSGESRFFISGPAGCLAITVNGCSSPRAFALICHPHPLFGGSMDNKVVFTLARACRDNGIIAVRMNFRGVGGSEGIFDNGVGERQDIREVLSVLGSQLAGLPLILGGFSFGAVQVARVAMEVPAAGLILAAPAIRGYGLEGVDNLAMPVLLLQNDDDEVVDSAQVYDWFAYLSSPQKKLQRWSSGGHFFHGMLPSVKQAAGEFLSTLTV